jgi:hypothetical protein
MGEKCCDIGNTLGDTLGAWGEIIRNMREHIKNMARTQIKNKIMPTPSSPPP